VLAHVGMLLQQGDGQPDQVVEIDRLIGLQHVGITRVNLGGHALVVVLSHARRRFGREHGVFPQADGPLPAPRLGVIGGGAGIAQQAGDVVCREDGELRLEPQRLPAFAQHAHA
jgi:hypothetical protein